ncbi:MAG TPA: ribonuclease R [Verrucomicrobiae bacterium]|nr:ribonuclease R [Verrucomicrobiae bacterium]
MRDDQIMGVLKAARGAPLDVHGIRSKLGLKASELESLKLALLRLEAAGRIVLVKADQYALPRQADMVPGRLRVHRTGSAHLEPDGVGEAEVFVPAEATGTAMHDDHVLVRIEPPGRGRPPRRGREGERRGSVVRILERANTELVGTLRRGKQLFFVEPDDPRFPHDVYLADCRLRSGGKANVGDKVVVSLLEWHDRHRNPEGVLTERIGRGGDPGVDVLAVMRQHKLPTDFPGEVVEEARRFGLDVGGDDLRGRRDCRGHDVITIDPPDAKDFDDAICVRREDGGGWRLWVHIADVSHYVKPGSALDREARRRGNSTYLVDRVIPMLPEALSNELCSLKPHVDRLTKCVEFRLDKMCRVTGAEFYPAVIRSRHRFAYGDVLAVIRGQARSPVEGMIRDAHFLAQRLRTQRMRAGALDLDMPEVKVWIDERGRVKSIERVEYDESHQLIEEYMLLANEAVARHLKRGGRAAVYRIHEDPDAERLEEYRGQVRAHGIAIGDLSRRAEVVKLLQRLRDHPCGQALRIGLLRSLKRARYAPKPLGHYGLAKADYTHFTSPIRRYADLIVHRATFEKGGRRPSSQDLDAIAEHISATERNSAEAEMASRKLKLFTFLQEQLDSGHPQRYEGMVTEVIHIGAFVDVPELGLTGLVPVSSMADDYYVFDAGRALLRGRRTRRTIGMGERVKVEVLRVDFGKMQVDFRMA